MLSGNFGLHGVACVAVMAVQPRIVGALIAGIDFAIPAGQLLRAWGATSCPRA
jgi:hypothetical protein